MFKVNVHGQILIKKEIPSPDTVDEFLYEVNALHRLCYSENVIRFYGVVVDNNDEYVKGLLISYADQGALIDIIYEQCKVGKFDIPWSTRKKWARQIVEGLSDIHNSGFVQGDFTLSNIVIDKNGDAKIIDINRRGCPVGWEPPEATPLIESNQRTSMYIGVKSDLYQLGMVLWALAMQEDEPEAQGRPLILGPEVNIPHWYREIAEICLSDDPRLRLQASSLLKMFPSSSTRDDRGNLNPPSMSVDEDYTLQQYLLDDHHPDNYPHMITGELPSKWSSDDRPPGEIPIANKIAFIESDLTAVWDTNVDEKVENLPMGNETRDSWKGQAGINSNDHPTSVEKAVVLGSSTEFQGLCSRHENVSNDAPSVTSFNGFAGSSFIRMSKVETGSDEVLDGHRSLREAAESPSPDEETPESPQTPILPLRALLFKINGVARFMGFDQGQEHGILMEGLQWGQTTIQWLRHLRDVVSDCIQPKIPSGYVRVSWTCVSSIATCIQVTVSSFKADSAKEMR